MTKFEDKIVNFVETNIHYLFFAAILILGIIARISGFNVISKDMSIFFIEWFNKIKELGGFKSLGITIGDYNILFQTITTLLTYIKVDNCVYLYKTIFCIFDIFLGCACATLVCKLKKSKCFGSTLYNIVFVSIYFLPTVILDSAFWGQCDSIYSFFIILTLYSLYYRKYTSAFILYGISFSFKLQSVFIFPLIVYIYFKRKDFSIFKLFYTLIVFWLSGIFGYINGRDILSVFRVYYGQICESSDVIRSTATFWRFVGNDQSLSLYALVFCVVIIGVGLYIYLLSNKEETEYNYLLISLWIIWTVLLFMPAMRQRYTYLIDILLILICFFNRKFVLIAAIEIAISTVTYGVFLFDISQISSLYSLANLLAYIYLSKEFFNELAYKKE